MIAPRLRGGCAAPVRQYLSMPRTLRRLVPELLTFQRCGGFSSLPEFYEAVGLSIWANPITQHFRQGDQSGVDPRGYGLS